MRLRIALLSLVEGSAGNPAQPRGNLPIGGRSVARHQLGLALALECRRIVIVAETMSQELIALQHAAEAAGAQFHAIAAARALVALVSPADELLVLGDGVLASPADAIAAIAGGEGVLTFPVDAGIAAGFERIDINHASAGVMLLPGRVVNRLGALPDDWSVPAALLRLATQAGMPQRELPAALLASGHWRLVRGEGEAQQAEAEWIALHTADAGGSTPGAWAAAAGVRAFGPTLLHAGTRPAVPLAVAGLLGLLGVGAGWFGASALGFGLLGAAWLVEQARRLLGRIEQSALLAAPPRWRADTVFSWLLDLGFVAVGTWRIAPLARLVPWSGEAFAPLIVMLALRLLPAALPRVRWVHWLEDRLLAAIVLALLTPLPFGGALRLVALALLAGGLVAAARNSPNRALTAGD